MSEILPSVGEGSSLFLSFKVKDKYGELSIPTSLSYSVYCATNNVIVRGNTAITPAVSSGEIHLTSTDTIIVNQDNPVETKVVTITAQYGSSDAINVEFTFQVDNLHMINGGNILVLPPVATINVKDYGATGLGVADDSDAINRATAALRTYLSSAGGDVGARLIFPQGRYKTTKGLDFTNLRVPSRNSFYVIEFYGATVVGSCPGKAAMDFTRSNSGRLINVHVYGDPAARPSIGIQVARGNDDETAAQFNFSNVKTTGEFTFASFYNLASEMFVGLGCSFWNDHEDTTSFGMVLDGRNKFGISSDYYPITIPINTQQSFNSQLFLQCDFRKRILGTPIHMTSCRRLNMINCYAVAKDHQAVTYDFDERIGTDLNFDLHAELSGEFPYVFKFMSSFPGITSGTIRGFHWKEINSGASLACLTTDDIAVELLDTDIFIGNYNANPTWGVFRHSDLFTVKGKITSMTNPLLSSDLTFDGTLVVQNMAHSEFVVPKGSIEILDITHNARVFKGQVAYLGVSGNSYTGDDVAGVL